MACEFCSASINIFTRKKCTECQRWHCSRCSAKLATSKVCVRCHRLISLTFTRQELEQYTVKELRQFLIRNKHRTDNYTEKMDLVEAVMKFSHAHNRSAEDSEHVRHVEQLKERMMKENSNSRPPTSASTTSGTSLMGSDSSTHLPSTAPSQVDEVVPSTPPLHDDDSTGALPTPMDPSTADAASADDATPPSFVPDPVEVPPIATQNSSTEPTSGTSNKRIALNQLSKVEDIEGLSVRQLKELLVTNYVDYKGCCERQELMDRVRRLWLDDRKNRGLVTDDNITSDVDVCKVCMDAVIDCILLECGHMVTCTQCGKRMAECPICRHYVSRVVHVFKA